MLGLISSGTWPPSVHRHLHHERLRLVDPLRSYLLDAWRKFRMDDAI